jgi:hypothetical protein
MTLYRRRAITVEAFQWQPEVLTMEDKHPIPDWLLKKCVVTDSKLEIFTPVGMITCQAGDWVVQDRKNLRVVDQETFDALFELIEG